MQRIAVIGSGISGLAAAYLLSDKYNVTIFEKNDYLGGHARTLHVQEEDTSLPIDTGFIVFNYETYPHLTGLFKALNVPVCKSLMSFGVSIDSNWLEYGSASLKALFSQYKNLVNLRFLRMVWDILKFNRISKKHLKNNSLDADISLSEYLKDLGVGTWFTNYYLLAMGAAIWSTPLQKMHEYPALTFIRFFNNHGLLETNVPVQWYTVHGGSEQYVSLIRNHLIKRNVTFSPGASHVKRSNTTVTVIDASEKAQDFNKVLFACHSDEALMLLDSPSNDEKALLSTIQFQTNTVVLHTDADFMPKNKKAWSSWVYLSEHTVDDSNTISLTYWMNNLQPLNSTKDYFVTVNPGKSPASEKIINSHVFSHPLFNQKAIEAQEKIKSIQGQNNTFFCGAYLRHGFHEDGIWSAVKVAEKLGVNIAW